jgi:hypothetical protein
MNELLKRRNLLAVPSTPDPLPQEAIAAVAARDGFPAAVSPPAPSSIVSRRKRQPTGRDHRPFAARDAGVHLSSGERAKYPLGPR